MNAAWIEKMMVRDLEAVQREIAAFPDEASVWATPPGITNSAGTLALHLAGNIQHFVGAILGKSGFVRERDREFAARGVSRAEITAGLASAIGSVRSTLGRPIDFDAVYPDLVGSRIQVVTGDWLVHLVSHLAFHLGQIGYVRRIVTGESRSTNAMSIGDLATAVKQPKPAES